VKVAFFALLGLFSWSLLHETVKVLASIPVSIKEMAFEEVVFAPKSADPSPRKKTPRELLS